MIKESKYFPSIIFFIITIIYCFPIFKNFSYWGQMDWDQFTFWNAVPRHTILDHHQFPLWNPFVNGGNVLLAHPHSPFLSPFYILVLLLGPIAGLKLQIIIHLFLGLLGMFSLAQYFKMDKTSSYLSSFTFMLCSIFPLHLTEGHTSWLTISFIPWIFLFYLKSFADKKYILASIFFLSMTIFSGSVDIFKQIFALLVIYSFFKILQLKKLISLKILLFIFSGTFLICAIKLIPMIEFLSKYPRESFFSHEDHYGTALSTIYKMLLSREQMLLDKLSLNTTVENGLLMPAWHEFGAYVGIIPLFLFIYGTLKTFKERWPLIVTGLFFFVIILGCKSPINLLKMIWTLPVYNSSVVFSRFIVGFIFSVSVLSGLGLTKLKEFLTLPFKKNKFLTPKIFSFLIVLFVLFDLYLVNSPIFKNAFRIKPIGISKNKFFTQKYDEFNFFDEDISRSSQYPIFLNNNGLLESYEIVEIKKGDIRTVGNSNYKGEAYLIESDEDVLIKYFSPNKITISANIKNDDILVLNQNYYKGWLIKDGFDIREAKKFKGLISTNISPGKREITFYFLPLTFLLGTFISSLSILVMVIWYKELNGISCYFKKR